jgi:hypothetical protein
MVYARETSAEFAEQEGWFIPGRPAAPTGLLARYRPLQPEGAANAYVTRFTRPGDLVVDLFCQGPTVIHEIVSAGRRRWESASTRCS